MRDSAWLRGLDKHVGKPLCFLFSLGKRFRRRGSEKEIKKILILELFEMGAAVMAYPSAQFLKERYPKADLYCLCTDKVREAWEILDLFPSGHVMTIDSRNILRFGLSLLRRIVQLRKMKIDLLIDLGLFMRIPSVIAFLSGAKRTAGFYHYQLEGLYRGSHYDCPVAFNQNTHVAKNFLAVALTAAGQGNDHPNLKRAVDLREFAMPRHRSDGRVRFLVRRKLQAVCPDYEAQPLILVCPDVGKNLSVRNYPRELYAKAIDGILAQRPESLVVLIGTPTDGETCRWIAGEVGRRQCVDFSGQTATLAELLELMHLSSLLIGNDNGPLHLASLTPCRILALFSTDSPFIYGPLGNCVILYQFYQCSPCISAFNHKHSCCRDNQCLKTLPPELVSDYALRLLKDELILRTCNNAVPYLI